MQELTEAEKAVLAFEHRRWIHAGLKDEAILKTFQMTPVRYQQWLLTIMDNPAAYAYDPVLVKRLRRLRDQRQHRRTSPACARRLL